nr:Crp/Fnr family transcriptional regulator [uncultured Bacteroides sp.]
MIDQEKYIIVFRKKLESYSFISQESWILLESLLGFKILERNEFLVRNGDYSKNLHFVCEGALRAYFTDSAGNVYTKNLFLENDLAGSVVSSILDRPSEFTLEALEYTVLISFNYKKFRQLANQCIDLKDFYIAYLERNWVIEKEPIEVSLAIENATERYLKLRIAHPNIDKRISQQHIASHLGITPTQLSRIRKSLKDNS